MGGVSGVILARLVGPVANTAKKISQTPVKPRTARTVERRAQRRPQVLKLAVRAPLFNDARFRV